MSGKPTIQLDIAGARYRVASDGNDAHLTRLAQIVSDRVESLAVKTGRTVPAPQLLALAALDLADDLLSAEKRTREIEAAALSAVERALERLEARDDASDPNATLTDGTAAP